MMFCPVSCSGNSQNIINSIETASATTYNLWLCWFPYEENWLLFVSNIVGAPSPITAHIQEAFLNWPYIMRID